MRITRARTVLVTGTAAALAVASMALANPAHAAAATTRISSTGGGAAADGRSELPGLSADGRYATFTSDATNLVPVGPLHFQSNVFVKDRKTGAVDIVSVSPAGVEGNRSSGEFLIPAPVTPDGRFVAFDSDAFNLVPGDTNNLTDVFLRDRRNRTTARLNVSTAGVQANANSGVAAMSADGRFVLFNSRATNLVAKDANGLGTDVFLRDAVAGTTTLVSTRTDGTQVGKDTLGWSISADGRFVLLTSLSRYTADDRNNDTDAFVKDLRTGAIERVSKTRKGKDFPGGTDFARASMSADGRFVAFNAAPAGQLAQIYVRDRQRRTTTLASVNIHGKPGNRASFGVSLSANGRFVAFNTTADDMAGAGPGNFAQVYVRDLQGKTTTLASVNFFGAPIGQSSGEIAVCDTGVAFDNADNLVVPPGNGKEQVYFRSF
jgi:Tol biopolymer transport system component